MYNHEKYLKCYYSKPVEHVVYILKITDKDIYKVGKSKRLTHRLYNLKQSLYEPFEVFQLLKFEDAFECSNTEASVKELLKPYNIRGEWFQCTRQVVENVINTFL